MKKITIAIDGFSSTGKSTLAKELAKKLGYLFVDSGAMYRAVTYFAIQNGFVDQKKFDKESLVKSLNSISLQFQLNEETGIADIFLNGINVEKEIRTLEVSNLVSPIAEVSEVRAKLVEQQQKMGKGKGIVMDGRDIGTVVFPNAELKIFMTANPQIRAKRRFDEMQQKQTNITFEEVLKNVEERDYIDSNRKDSPLRKAEDAIEIDNSNLSREEQFQKVLHLAKSTIEKINANSLI